MMGFELSISSDFKFEEIKNKYIVEIELEMLFPFFDFSQLEENKVDELRQAVVKIIKKALPENIELLPVNFRFGIKFFESPKIYQNVPEDIK